MYSKVIQLYTYTLNKKRKRKKNIYLKKKRKRATKSINNLPMTISSKLK